MRTLIIAAGTVLAAAFIHVGANAACFGRGTFATCNDNAGTSYTVNRFGNTTQMNGYNARTGSEWSETTRTMGNMTQYNGMTNGQPWNMTRQNFGGMTTYNGMNASGQPF